MWVMGRCTLNDDPPAFYRNHVVKATFVVVDNRQIAYWRNSNLRDWAFAMSHYSLQLIFSSHFIGGDNTNIRILYSLIAQVYARRVLIITASSAECEGQDILVYLMHAISLPRSETCSVLKLWRLCHCVMNTFIRQNDRETDRKRTQKNTQKP